MIRRWRRRMEEQRRAFRERVERETKLKRRLDARLSALEAEVELELIRGRGRA